MFVLILELSKYHVSNVINRFYLFSIIDSPKSTKLSTGTLVGVLEGI